MPGSTQLSPKVSVGGQPSVADLRRLRTQGFSTVVDLRVVGEPEQPMPPEAEGAAVRELGLDYHHIPVALTRLDPAQVTQLCAAIDASGGPVYVHCAAGQRACSFTLLASSRGAPLLAEDVLARAESLGFPVTDAHLALFLREQAERARQRLLQAI